jgi:bifunctional non-homologous end joining protein LigD
LISRNGHHLTQSFPEIAESLQRLPFDQFVIDGEIVANDEQGVPSFSLLQQRARLAGELEVARAAIELRCTYYVFDALQIDGYDLRPVPLEKRKELLKRLLPASGPLRYCEHIVGRGQATFEAAVGLGLEGVVAKRRRSSYQAGRSTAWIKVRSQRTGDYVIVGWLANRNNADDLGELALGEYRESGLTYVGRVGSGLSSTIRKDLLPRLKKLAQSQSLSTTDRKGAREVHWVAPKLVCEVGFKEYTRDGQLRQPAFKRLRDDKPAAECLGRFDDPSGRILAPAPDPEVTVTHHDKVFYPELGLTKGDLVKYYEDIAPWMLPYLRDRPIVLTRYPDGIHGKSFYQRDAPDFVPDWIQREVLWSEGAQREVHYFIVQSAAALKYLANLGTIPIHVWHSRIADLEHPDWCVLDLDPKKAPFKDVIKLARGIRELAEQIELPCYPKTSGASGLHVLIPLGRQLTHDQAKTLGERMARVIVERYPDIATIARNVASRHNKVYVDYLQNGQGRSIAAPFTARAEPSACVSMPVKWREVNARLDNKRFHIKNAAARLRRLDHDPLAPIRDDEPDLARALACLADIMAAP